MDEKIAVGLILGFAAGFLLGIFIGSIVNRPDPSRGKQLRMDVTEEKIENE